MTRPTSLADSRAKAKTVYFNRRELDQILAVYSRHVIRGEWRDYAIDHRDGFACFSVFRHSHESPLFTIMKSAGHFQIYSGRRKLSAGSDLASLLVLFRTRPSLVSG